MKLSNKSIVRNAVKAQASKGSQIIVALKSIQDMTVQVQNGTGAIHQRSDEIRRGMKNLQTISQELTTSVDEVRKANGTIADFLDNAKSILTT